MTTSKSKKDKKKIFNLSPHTIMKGTAEEILNDSSSIKGNDNAPIMGFLDEESTKDMRIRDRMKGLGPNIGIMFRMIIEMRKSKKSIKKNPKKPQTVIKNDLLRKLNAYASELGVIIGFTKLRRELIFRNEAVLFENVIVLSMEMDYDLMDKAPSPETQLMIMKTYNDLGVVTNKITSFLRKNGFGAQACHPLGGAISYPPLIGDACMGWYGKHGIAIIPEFGPRHRVAAVLTSIENLPVKLENEHNWIEEYCETCGRCIRKCPAKAIYENSVKNDDGSITHINSKLCFQEFSTNYGCSVCVKECMFNKYGYEKIKKIFENRKKKD